jgi:hypothetical protein
MSLYYLDASQCGGLNDQPCGQLATTTQNIHIYWLSVMTMTTSGRGGGDSVPRTLKATINATLIASMQSMKQSMRLRASVHLTISTYATTQSVST